MANIRLRERVSSRLLMSLAQNYRGPVEAILELVDNGIDDRDRTQKVYVEIMVSKQSIEVVNRGGYGMGPDELDVFLNWGTSSKRNRIGRYGQGGKAACMYLGRELQIKTAKRGENVAYVLTDPFWGEREDEDDFRKYDVKEVHRQSGVDGFVEIEVRRLRRKISLDRLRTELSDTYRLLLASGEVAILLNAEPLTPFEIEAERREEFDTRLPAAGRVRGWVGILPPRSPVSGGVRICMLGRKLKDGERFGHPGVAVKAALARLAGEADVEHLEPNINKTDIDRSSRAWQQVEHYMHDLLRPLVVELSSLRGDDPITEEEQEKCRRAGEQFAEFLRAMRAREIPGDLHGRGESVGQKPQELQHAARPQNKTLESRGPNQPATPSPREAIGKRRRTGGVIQPILTSALPPHVRSRLEEREGKKVLLINTTFPVYKSRRGDELYIQETLCMEYAGPEEGETRDSAAYVEEFNKLLADCCQFRESQVETKRPARRRRP